MICWTDKKSRRSDLLIEIINLWVILHTDVLGTLDLQSIFWIASITLLLHFIYVLGYSMMSFSEEHEKAIINYAFWVSDYWLC